MSSGACNHCGYLYPDNKNLSFYKCFTVGCPALEGKQMDMELKEFIDAGLPQTPVEVLDAIERGEDTLLLQYPICPYGLQRAQTTSGWIVFYVLDAWNFQGIDAMISPTGTAYAYRPSGNMTPEEDALSDWSPSPGLEVLWGCEPTEGRAVA